MLLIAGLGYGGQRVWMRIRPATDVTSTGLTYKVKQRTLRVTVSERGNLESQQTVDGTCELNSYENKIIFIVEEGTAVKKGDVVVRFDGSKIDESITQQEIEVNQAKAEVDAKEQEVEVMRNANESEIATADLELQLAKLDLKKYEKGDYLVKQNELKGKISLAESELQQARDAHMHFKELVKSGYKEPEQLQIAKQNVESAQFNLQRDKESLRVLEDFEHERSLTEFAGKSKEAERKLERANKSTVAKLTKAVGAFEAAKATLKMREMRMAELLKEKEKCEILAPQDGIVAYSENRRYGGQPIGPGVTVYQRQTIFHLPDMDRLKVKVNVHESVVKKIKTGQKATIRVDAFPNILLKGTVSKVSMLASSSRSWMQGGVKEYTTFVTIDELPDEPLRPGMTAEVEVMVGKYDDVLAVPVQAITEQDGNHYAFVKQGDSFESRQVKVGHSNYKFVEVTTGVQMGDEIALDARERALEARQQNEHAFEDKSDDVNEESPENEEQATEATTDSTEVHPQPDTTGADAHEVDPAQAAEPTEQDAAAEETPSENESENESENKSENKSEKPSEPSKSLEAKDSSTVILPTAP